MLEALAVKDCMVWVRVSKEDGVWAPTHAGMDSTKVKRSMRMDMPQSWRNKACARVKKL